MAGSVNKAIVVGNLGKDVEMRFLNDGKAVANFSVATSEKWEKDGQKKERTEWHRIVAWGKLGELCGQYLSKGSKCYVEGKLQTREYEKDGVKRYSTEIVASEVMFLSEKAGSSKPAASPGAPAQDEADIPF
jgi:single-strand DNA-binding protein